MEHARDLALAMQKDGKGRVLDQFANPDNPLAHYRTTGPEIWRDTEGRITHFVSSMGTTGTIMGAGRFLKEKNPSIVIIGCQPDEGSQIPGIRKWPEAYLPKIYDARRVDRVEEVSQADAEEHGRRGGHALGIRQCHPRRRQAYKAREQVAGWRADAIHRGSRRCVFQLQRQSLRGC